MTPFSASSTSAATSMLGADSIPPGVVTGADLFKLYTHAREHGYAIPSFRCSSSKMCNNVLEAARRSRSPVAIRITYAAGITTGSSCSGTNISHPKNIAVAGAVALALHVRTMAPEYGVAVVLQSETRCQHQLATWYEDMLAANESYYSQFKEPLYSSHLLDLTADVYEEEENLAIASMYLERLDPIKVWLEVRLFGCDVAGSHDLIHTHDVNDTPSTTAPQQVLHAFETLSRVGNGFSLALDNASFWKYYKTNQGWKQFLGDADAGKEIFLTLDTCTTAEANNKDDPKQVAAAILNGNIVQLNVNGLDSHKDNNCRRDEEGLVDGCMKLMERLHSSNQFCVDKSNEW